MLPTSGKTNFVEACEDLPSICTTFLSTTNISGQTLLGILFCICARSQQIWRQHSQKCQMCNQTENIHCQDSSLLIIPRLTQILLCEIIYWRCAGGPEPRRDDLIDQSFISAQECFSGENVSYLWRRENLQRDPPKLILQRPFSCHCDSIGVELP